MGLFSKKVCARCGSKAGLLTRQKLADGDLLCGDCVALCSDEMESEDFQRMTVDDIEDCIKAVEEDAERYKNEFHTTTTFRAQMALKGKDVVYVDDNHGWWVNATRNDPDIFTLDQVGSCWLELETSQKDEDDEKSKENPLLDLFGGMGMAMQYPGLPACPPGEQIEKMTCVVSILNHPYVSKVKIPVMDCLIPSEGDIKGGYDCALQLTQYFNGIQQSKQKAQQQQDLMAAAAQAAASAVQATQAQASGGGDIADQLTKLKSLVDSGILTQEEFDAKKKQLLGL
ncbi:MAG: SHOCT domain-containing protein [Lachnospiraceae bacterium]|nr:SHOCT domain-containing protein [Lachnospiraceae bacterium]